MGEIYRVCPRCYERASIYEFRNARGEATMWCWNCRQGIRDREERKRAAAEQ